MRGKHRVYSDRQMARRRPRRPTAPTKGAQAVARRLGIQGRAIAKIRNMGVPSPMPEMTRISSRDATQNKGWGVQYAAPGARRYTGAVHRWRRNAGMFCRERRKRNAAKKCHMPASRRNAVNSPPTPRMLQNKYTVVILISRRCHITFTISAAKIMPQLLAAPGAMFRSLTEQKGERHEGNREMLRGSV